MKAAMLASFLLAAALVTTGIATPLQSDRLSQEVNDIDIDVNDDQVNHEWVSEDFPEDVDRSDGYIEEVDPSDSDVEEGDPSDGYVEEMPEQLEKYASNNNLQPACSEIKHGSTIALQPLYNKRYWLGCAGSICRAASCPKLYMKGTDWRNCWGEVFRIYRRGGPGTVTVGDQVGIYYPRESGKWLGCAGSKCGKAGCPGLPSRYGFQNPLKWSQCWGEVFKIYARGKSIGDSIHAHDHVLLYYVRGRNWLALSHNVAHHETCPGRVLPPPISRYEPCWGENFEIWKR